METIGSSFNLDLYIFLCFILVFNNKINFYLIRNQELLSKKKKKLEPFTTNQSHVQV
jgi:hypothetical protein